MTLVLTLAKAFLVGGLLCVIGQILIDKTNLTPAKILVLYVLAGVVLGAVGLYAPLAEFAGAGATVPLTGFGFNLAKTTAEAVNQDGLWGVLKGPFSAASIGTMTAVLSALAVSVFARSKDK